MTARYCIGCKKFDFTAPDPGRMGSTWTGVYGDRIGEFACSLGHWKLYINRDTEQLDLENAMLHANTCPDWEDRHPEISAETQPAEPV